MLLAQNGTVVHRTIEEAQPTLNHTIKGISKVIQSTTNRYLMILGEIEMNAARFLIRETRSHRIIRVGDSWGCQQRLFGSQISIHHRYHHLDNTNNPPTARKPSSFVCYVATTPPPYYSSFFSTYPAAAAVVEKKEKQNARQQTKENNSKKSPHSKLLRVCSDRNANSHFAAIEGKCLI